MSKTTPEEVEAREAACQKIAKDTFVPGDEKIATHYAGLGFDAGVLFAQGQCAEAVHELRTYQRQLDADGVFVGVSRQALDEVLQLFEQPAEEKTDDD